MKKDRLFIYIFLSGVLIVLFTASFFGFYTFRRAKVVNVTKEDKLEPKSEVATEPIEQNQNLPVTKDAEPPETIEIRISSVGDCTLGSDDKFYKPASLPGVLQNHNNDYGYLFKNVSSIFEKDDITTANLETTLTNSDDKRPDRQFNFKGSPELAKSLVLGSIEGVTLSNNHIYDYNQQGFKDTIQALKDNGINYFGEGHQWLTTVKGVKLAFLGYTGWSNDKGFLNNLKKDITDLKSKDYTVIINIHWGEESQYSPNGVQKSIAHFAIDNGADLVIGHHPHVIQGIEKYKDRFICYSLANFCFGGNSNPPDKDTFILQTSLKFVDKKLSTLGIKVVPCSVSSVSNVNDYCPTPLTGEAKNKFFEKLNKLSISPDLQFADDFKFININ